MSPKTALSILLTVGIFMSVSSKIGRGYFGNVMNLYRGSMRAVLYDAENIIKNLKEAERSYPDHAKDFEKIREGIATDEIIKTENQISGVKGAKKGIEEIMDAATSKNFKYFHLDVEYKEKATKKYNPESFINNVHNNVKSSMESAKKELEALKEKVAANQKTVVSIDAMLIQAKDILAASEKAYDDFTNVSWMNV